MLPADHPSADAAAEASRHAAERLEEFRELRARGALCTAVTDQLATEAASRFLEQFRSTGGYLADAITLLAEIATLEEPCLSQPGQRATFPLLVERLSDSFEPAACLLYDRAFAQMISVARRRPAGAWLDAALGRFNLNGEQDLLQRKAQLRKQQPWRNPQEQRAVRKAVVLSRVTLGADVAVTSVVLQKSQLLFPNAERVLLAPGKARELLGGDDSLRIHEIPYPSGGTLLERLESWLRVVEALEEEIRGLRRDEYAVIDPDSRYLQLGLLPALRDESRYFFFESRSYDAMTSGATVGAEPAALSRLTLHWLNATFGGEDAIVPRLWLRPPDVQFGGRVGERLRRGGARWIAAVSFGAGGNMEKRLPDPFEEQLLARLIELGSTIILDQGAGEEELRRASRLIGSVKGIGGAVIELDRDNAPQASQENSPLRCQLLSWQGSIGAWSGLIGASDEYLGYDSAGQHIAAALGVPTVDIFSAQATPLFRERWQPAGRGIVRVVAEGERTGTTESARAALEEVIEAHRAIRTLRSGS